MMAVFHELTHNYRPTAMITLLKFPIFAPFLVVASTLMEATFTTWVVRERIWTTKEL
jgi:hypothetical protein